MIVSLLASIPNGSYEVERVTCNQREKMKVMMYL